jgi:hypothetical protein
VCGAQSVLYKSGRIKARVLAVTGADHSHDLGEAIGDTRVPSYTQLFHIVAPLWKPCLSPG